jgi:hypothetical protein
MGNKLEIPISLGDRSADNVDYRDNLLVNRIMVARDIKGDQGYTLSHSGLTQYGTAEGIDRGGIYNARQRNHLRISGDSLIEVDTDGSTSVIGVIPGSGQTSLPYSFQTQGVVSNGRFWLYDGTTLTEVLDPDLGAPIDADWINGVYLFTDGETLYHTTAASETAIDPQAFATSEFSPDRTLGVLKNKQNQMVVFNRFSTEWFVDRGDITQVGQFRFRRIEGKSVKCGVVGTHAKTEMDGQIFILGNRKEESPSVHILAGGNQNTIATREIDKIIAEYNESELATAVLEARVQDRDKFIIVRLSRHVLLYNHAIALKFGIKYAWTTLKTDIAGDSPWRARNGVFDPRNSKWIYGDSLDSRLGELDNTTNLQYGEKIEEILYTPIVPLEQVSLNMLEVDSLPGFSADSVDCFVSLSYDGVTYGQEVVVQVSRKFDYNLRFIARRLGFVRDEVSFKFRIVANGRTALSRMVIDFS